VRLPRSIYWRLSLLFLVTLTFTLIGHSLLVILPGARVLAKVHHQGLRREASLAATTLGRLLPPEDHKEEIHELLERVFRPAPNLSVLLFDAQGNIHASLRPPTWQPVRSQGLRMLIQELGDREELLRPVLPGRPPIAMQRLSKSVPAYFVAVTAERSGRALIYEHYPGLWLRTLILLFLVAGGAGLWGLRLLTSRLSQLRKGMERLAAGDLSVRLQPGREDEIGSLIRAFNTTASELETAVSELEEQDRARREMLADVSHELRTPLTTIRGHLELLQEDREQMHPAHSRSVDILMEEAQALQQRIEDLLALARQEAGQIQLLPQETELGDFLADLSERFRVPCQERDIRLEMLRPPEPMVAVLDPDRLGQVLRNLLENALHNLRPGDSLTAKVFPEEAGFCFEIEDTGPGIPPDELPLLFERFRRGKGARGAGTGLGLAIARKLVELHGGKCTATSQLGAGSCFRVWLPATCNAPTSPDHGSEKGSPPCPPAPTSPKSSSYP
jgi:signal transduction histidine kinase